MQRVLVTGATSGIGRAIALALHGAGHAVTAAGRDPAALGALAQAAPGIGTLRIELTGSDAPAAAAAAGAFDVLVNNAGVMPPPGPFAGMAAADIDRTVAVNLGAVLALTRAVLPGMLARGRGHLVFIGSQAAHAPGANFAVYAATKAAVAAFAAALRAELAPSGLRVTEIAPGRVETGLYEDVLDPGARAAMYSGGGSLQPEDVAEVLLAVLRLPERAAVSRLDIVPTRPVPPVPIRRE
ncbi:MAG: SDR family NAD(P)-dependent oxidoreductase [Rhodobacteraceae bacterium]|nr:SDR family NAD(P)-dependent oxidoreductase [Paracoccaceae bacterium]